MKKILFLIGGLLSSLAINAQIMTQSDVAILISMEDNNGTARYNAMSGAFGALGGDLSAGDVNPAGLAIFKNSQASVTFGLKNTDLTASFTGNANIFNDSYFNLTQVGGVLVFDTNTNSHWKKFALGFNYSLAKDFENFYNVKGNAINNNGTDIFISQFADPNGNSINLLDHPSLNFDGDPLNDIRYNNFENQFFENRTNGQNEKFTLSLSAQANDNVYLGLSVVTHNVDSYQSTLFEHASNDGNGNTFDSSFLQELRTFGEGIGLTFGALIKISKEARLGLSYQTPTWYNLTDEFIDDLEIGVSTDSDLFVAVNDLSATEYKFNTPSRLTGSFAYLFGKEGLISFDYTYKDYQNIKLRPTNDFSIENQDLSTTLKGSSQLKVGAEWRIDNISLRGGYFYEQSPFEGAIDTDNIEGYSVGIGFKFGNKTKLDLAYQNSNNTGVYNFANADNFPGAELDITNDKFTATLVIGL